MPKDDQPRSSGYNFLFLRALNAIKNSNTNHNAPNKATGTENSSEYTLVFTREQETDSPTSQNEPPLVS